MNRDEFYTILLNTFPHSPTTGQQRLLGKLVNFVFRPDQKSMFVLKGYAGTGKTTVISSLVKALQQTTKRSVLLAPTGRAAKVLSSYSGRHASTIHRKIYLITTAPGGMVRLALTKNMHRNTFFLVDEASMIPDQNAEFNSFFSGHNLLDDLIQYVYSGVNNRLILIGDTAQLPPVGLELSPALDLQYLKSSYHYSIYYDELNDVVRQSLDSGVLANATEIRNSLDNTTIEELIKLDGFDDIQSINGEMLEEYLNDAFPSNSFNNSVIVTRTNKRANVFNQEVRNRILFRENEIATGDLLMVVRNNYFWLEDTSAPGFLANGDIIEIQKIIGYEEMYDLRFADVVVRMLDYPDEHDINIKIMLDTLQAEGPSLPQDQMNQLFESVMQDYDDLPSRRKRVESVKNNPHFNAVQVKFAYALTCHKTQGGQWENVFIDLGYLNEEHINRSFFRWLYTAFTRATKKLYLVNFPEKFFA